ncbi:MAG: hypothetical protein NTX81_06390 [Candidatus Bathyarchaeota archaeon]|nr:hypothetical protein [Candidatus Bathyarchaeota archaeon]
MPEAKFCISCGALVSTIPPESNEPSKNPYLRRNIAVAVVLVFIVASSILIFGLNLKTSTQNPTTTGTYIFIQQHTHIHGESLEGNYRGPMIDFPTYSFDNKTGTLRGMMNFEINDTLVAIYGSGLGLSGAAGGGASTSLYGVFDLPYKKDDLQILRIDLDGTAHISYRGLSITLRNGEEWTNTTSRIDSKEVGNMKGKAMLTITDKIINHGILEKSKVIVGAR